MTASFMATLQKRLGLDAKSNPQAFGKLWTAAEQAKRNVSANLISKFTFDDFHDGLSYSGDLTRAKFEDLNRDLFLAAFKPVEQVLNGKFQYPPIESAEPL